MSSSLTSSPFLFTPPENTGGKHCGSVATQHQFLNFPELQCGQYAVLQAKLSPDGSVLMPDCQSYLDSEDGSIDWQVFDSFQEARAGAIEAVVANPFELCAIFNAGCQHIHTIRNGQPVPLEVLLAQQIKSSKAWWQVWK